MAVKRIDPFDQTPRTSLAVVHGNTAYIGGVVADDTSGDVKDQTKQILAEMDRLLAAAGTDKSKLISVNIWLTDINTFADMNAVWDAWVAPGNFPARATVEARLAEPQYKVEMMAVAAIG